MIIRAFVAVLFATSIAQGQAADSALAGCYRAVLSDWTPAGKYPPMEFPLVLRLGSRVVTSSEAPAGAVAREVT
jgi:hypothetical protein